MNRTAVIVVLVVVILILAPRVFGATVMLPGFVQECVWISVKDMAEDRVERVDYCRVPPVPVNPFAGDMFAKVDPDLFVNEYPAPPTSVVGATALDIPRSRSRRGTWQAGGTSIPSPLGVPPFTVTVIEWPREPDTPVETLLPPLTPVPLPASMALLLTALGLLWRARK